MLQAFIIVLREGFEAFLIVAITIAYLQKTNRLHLVRAVAWGVAASILTSSLMGYFLWVTQGVHTPLWEGILGIITTILVMTLVIHMWKMGPRWKQEMEGRLEHIATTRENFLAYLGVFLFTLVMISREGMETALLLIQIHEAQIVAGVVLGVAAAVGMAILWQQFSSRINMKHFFRVTSVYLLLFAVQVAVNSFHEFTETGLLPNSEYLHVVSEIYSSEGAYGRLYSWMIVAFCGVWYAGIWGWESLANGRKAVLVPPVKAQPVEVKVTDKI